MAAESTPTIVPRLLQASPTGPATLFISTPYQLEPQRCEDIRNRVTKDVRTALDKRGR